MNAFRLQDLCPRLAYARDQWVAFSNARHETIAMERENVWRLEALVAHRELQEVRAMAACARATTQGARRSAGAYLADRQRKLKDAQAALARAVRRLTALREQRP